MSGDEILVSQIGHCRAEMSPEGSEERLSRRHAVILVAQQPLAAVLRVGFASNVARLDHPVDEIGDCRGRNVHTLPQLRQGQRCARSLGDHDVQKGVEVVVAHIVHMRKVPADAFGSRSDRADISRQQLLQLPPARRWVISVAFGHLPASFIDYPGYGVLGRELSKPVARRCTCRRWAMAASRLSVAAGSRRRAGPRSPGPSPSAATVRFVASSATAPQRDLGSRHIAHRRRDAR